MKKIMCLLLLLFSSPSFAQQQVWAAMMHLNSGDKRMIKYNCDTAIDSNCAATVATEADSVIDVWSSWEAGDYRLPYYWEVGERPSYTVFRVE